MSSRFDPNLLLAPQMAFGSFAGARQAQQEQQAIDLNRLKLMQAEQAMQQQQELAPTMQRLQELELQAAEQQASQRSELLDLKPTYDVLKGISAYPEDQRTPENVKGFIDFLQLSTGKLIPQEEISQAFDERGLISNDFLNASLQSLGGRLGIKAVDVPADIKEFNTLFQKTKSKDPEEARAARIALKLEAGKGTLTGKERIPQTGMTEDVAESQQQIAEAEQRGKGIAQTATGIVQESIKKINGIEANINNIDRAISALDKGAKTGAIERLLPNVTAASVELNQIGSELGLDVVGAVTFGALSAGELNLSLDTALPTGLDEPELKQYLTDKRNSQKKLINYLEEQMSYLESGGTVSGWRELVKQKGEVNKQEKAKQQSKPEMKDDDYKSRLERALS